MRPVSIIIATFNRSGLLRSAVESVLSQTYPKLEIIVVDDGSTDDTAQVMEAYSDRVRYVRQSNAGVSAARNRGIREATGDFIGFLDDDDLFLPEKVEKQAALLDTLPAAGLVHCRYYHVNEAGKRLNRIGLLPSGHVLRELVCKNFLWMSAPLIRRECLNAVGSFDETLSTGADYDLWVRIARAGFAFGCVQEPLGAYRIQRGSMVTNMARTEREVITILDRVFAAPGLPGDVIAVRDQAYATWRFWFSRRYYAAGDWDNARRNLSEALSADPSLVKNREAVLQGFCSEALDERVENPLQYIEDMLDHLPASADFIRSYRLDLLGRVRVGVALRQYSEGDLAQARQGLADAISACTSLAEQAPHIARNIFDNAMCLPVEPTVYAGTVFGNLPENGQLLQQYRARVFSDINIGCAFEDYMTGHRKRAARRVLNAVFHRPVWLKNRGVVSMLVKSLPAFVAGTETASS